MLQLGNRYTLYLCVCSILLSCALQAQTTTLTRQVIGSDYEPLSNAAVEILDQNGQFLQGVLTKVDGTFKLEFSEEARAIRIQYVGLRDLTLDLLTDVPNPIRLEIALGLPEAVVTAVGISKSARSIGYATTALKGEELLLADETNFVQCLAGKVAGL